eukprot:gene25710-34287_t
MYYWHLRNSRTLSVGAASSGVNAQFIIEFILLGMHTYFFLFFKIQTAPSILMPPQYNIYEKKSPYFMFTVNLHVMAIFQLAYVLVLVPARASSNSSSKQAAPAPSTISVWRSILVANEWAELQTIRKTNLKFTLFFMSFLMVAQSLQYNGALWPELEDKTEGPFNVILRFANTTFFWLLISYGQYLLKYLVYEQFIVEPPEQIFIDFCTIAKISMIVLDEKYHGYYLHCRSPHQYADATMSELVEMLHKEEAGLTSDRSLEGAPPDVQAFKIFLSGEWRMAFDKIYLSLVGAAATSEAANQSRARAVQAKAGARSNNSFAGMKLGQINFLPTDKVVNAWKELTVFLQEFIENNFGATELRRIIREPTYFEKLFEAGPNLTIPLQPSVFFTDRNFYYTKVIFLGREMDLLLLNILTYSLCDFWFNSTMTSVFLTYLLEYLICFIRKTWGQAMISRKTLIDQRFLI